MSGYAIDDGGLAGLKAAFAMSPRAQIIADAGGNILYANAAADGFGTPGMSLADVIADWAVLGSAPVERPFFSADWQPRWGRADRVSVVLGEATYEILTIADVTDEVACRDDRDILTLVANETDRAVIVTDSVGTMIYVNRTFCEIFGYAPHEAIGKRAGGFLSEGGVDQAMASRMYAQVALGETYQEELVALDKAGKQLWLSASVSPSIAADGSLRHLTITLANITESKQLQVLQRDVLEAVAQDQPLGNIMLLLCERVEAMAPGVTCSVLAVDAEQCLRPMAAPSLPSYFGEAIDGVKIGPKHGSCGTAAYRGEVVTVTDIATDPLWDDFRDLPLPLGLLACWSSPIKLRDGRVAGTFAFYYREKRGPSPWHEHIVSACLHLCMVAIERHEAKAHIAKLAYYDTLTGLPNRAMLKEQIQTMIKAGPGDGRRLAFMFLDLDRFKDVNDTLGHSVGDALLVEIARRLQRQLRSHDAISRLGGDEFVAVIADCDAQKAAAIAERLGEALAEPLVIEGHVLPVSASIGVSLYPDDGQDEETLLKHADAAMYEAKNAGRSTFRFFSPQSNSLAQERLVLGAALRDSISRGLMRLHYQPQIRANDGTLHGVEALARWSHALAGEVAPMRFIALAEECGLIEAIGDWALNEACRQMADWRERGIDVPSVSVNLSPLHFRNPTLFDTVSNILDRYDLEPGRLTIEITESIMMEESLVVIQNAKALVEHGVLLSMDDFGTGYSSLGHLAKLPVKEIKIDRSFMRGLDDDPQAQALVTAVVRIGQSLGLLVVAEGVETESHRKFLSALDCQVLQGFLFSKALPPAELEAWLALAWQSGQDRLGAA